MDDIFLSTPSARRATSSASLAVSSSSNFYPRPPRGGRQVTDVEVESIAKFLSTPSARRATAPIDAALEGHDDFYPRPPRGGRLPLRELEVAVLEFLSTPSARRATECLGVVLEIRRISIHALREEGDPGRRRASASRRHFYPRPPRGGRLLFSALRFQTPEISIHALREEGDADFYAQSTKNQKFLSTPSARRATIRAPPRGTSAGHFYPRPPRGGRPRLPGPRGSHRNFYPRPPRGGRPCRSTSPASASLFLSTPSARRATVGVARLRDRLVISIHALREEGDSKNRDKISIFKQIIQHSARI